MSRIKKYRGMALVAILILAAFLYGSSLFLPHLENDEVIYQTLVSRTSQGLDHYNLDGTIYSQKLPEIYDSRLFYHPPFFIISLLPIWHILGNGFLILLPIFSGVAVIFLTYCLAVRLLSPLHGLLSCVFLLFCPLLTFASTRLLMETYLTAWLLLMLVFLLQYEEKWRWRYLLLSALCFALASLIKISAAFLIPLVVFIIMTQRDTLLARSVALAFFFFIVTALNVPWYLYFKMHQGSWLFVPNITEQTKELLPFIREVCKRPAWLCLIFLPWIYPIYLFGYLRSLMLPLDRSGIILTGCAGSVLLGYFLLAQSSNLTVQARYLVPALPAMAILSADFVIQKRGRWVALLCLLFVGIGFGTGLLNSFVSRPADVHDIFWYVKYLYPLNHPAWANLVASF